MRKAINNENIHTSTDHELTLTRPLNPSLSLSLSLSSIEPIVDSRHSVTWTLQWREREREREEVEVVTQKNYGLKWTVSNKQAQPNQRLSHEL